jgi:hypothetical protein
MSPLGTVVLARVRCRTLQISLLCFKLPSDSCHRPPLVAFACFPFACLLEGLVMLCALIILLFLCCSSRNAFTHLSDSLALHYRSGSAASDIHGCSLSTMLASSFSSSSSLPCQLARHPSAVRPVVAFLVRCLDSRRVAPNPWWMEHPLLHTRSQGVWFMLLVSPSTSSFAYRLLQQHGHQGRSPQIRTLRRKTLPAPIPVPFALRDLKQGKSVR